LRREFAFIIGSDVLKRVVCIIQTRIGSTRLPGKVLMKVQDKTVVEHVVNRIRKIKNIDDIVLATTTLERDDLVVNEANRLGVKYYRGSEADVLSRYYYSAKAFNADVVVRVTSDCPLIDSGISKNIVDFYLSNIREYDYVSNTIERTYPRGLDTEVFSFQALERAFNEAYSERDREHVTPYIWDNPQIFKLYHYKNEEDYSMLRWTLDTKEDLQLINEIYNFMYREKKYEFDMRDIINLYDSHKELKDINKNIEQKKI